MTTAQAVPGPVTPDTRCSCGSVDLRAVVADLTAKLADRDAQVLLYGRVLKRYRDAGVSIPAEVTR